MARVKLPYETVNFLSSFLVKKQQEKIMENYGKIIHLKEIEEDLAQFCSLTQKAIIAIKRGDSQPSLSVAMKIAEYFEVSVHEIFRLKEVKGGNIGPVK